MAIAGKGAPLLQFLLIFTGVLLVKIFTHNLHHSESLEGALYILIMSFTAFLASYEAGIFAILLSALAINFVISPHPGINLNNNNLFEIIEITLTGLIITLMAWRAKHLRSDNILLKNTADKLKIVSTDLIQAAKGNKNKIDKLESINKDLENLVDEFIGEDDYWSQRWAKLNSKK